MNASIRSLTALPLDDHACRDCGGRGYTVDTSAHDHAPGAMVTRICNTCRPQVADTAPRVSSAQILDAAHDEWRERDPEGYARHLAMNEAEYWSLVALASVVTLIGTVAAQMFLDMAVGVV